MNVDFFSNILKEVKKKKFFVIGDILLDKYFFTEIERISPEAPVPIAKIKNEKITLGGAANVAANLSGLGAKVEIFGLVGNDINGNFIYKELKKHKIGFNKEYCQRKIPSIVKTRVLAQNQQVIRIDKEEIHPVPKNIQKKIIAHIRKNSKDISGVVLSDYNKGVLDESFSQNIITLCNNIKLPVFVDAKKTEPFKNAFLFKPNLKEAEAFTGIKTTSDLSNLGSILSSLQKKVKAKNIVVTLSDKGMALFQKNKLFRIHTHPKEVYDVSGAGDTVLASLVVAFSTNQNQKDTLTFANFNAEIIVGILGTAVITPERINHYLKSHTL